MGVYGIRRGEARGVREKDDFYSEVTLYTYGRKKPRPDVYHLFPIDQLSKKLPKVICIA